MRLGTLEAICDAPDRQPGDLLEHIEDDPPTRSPR
ncbi:MAG: hypothetical protein EPN69_12905 [Rhodanobacter sp.]|nr:MAG: hypothetical protein EPN71_14250 [Rhodanobacter sp.]TAL90170.1 MAG: hypothetical protein EPN69_12905 [Rhodanobacter sp.]TAM38099.1 MAG: hypothetical protein EPN58_17945 [Rhodanobacter sp.]